MQSILYLRHRQTAEGGFTASVSEKKPALGPTSAAVRALKYFGAEVPKADECRKFVADCFDKESGGFRPMPGEGKPDVFTTAVGIMAVVELKMPVEDYARPVLDYFAKNARSFEEIRIAAAGLESLGKPSPKAKDWLATLGEMRNEDGSFGKGEDRPRATGGGVACQLRLGEKVKDPKAVIAVLKEGQRPDGAYRKEGAKTSDLETTYRVVRSLVMLKERPDVGKLKDFIASCHNDNGGYGVTPGAPSSVSGTYYAAIMLHWIGMKK
jgi:prenyltransferase beta subunit